jgi:hypothetical protein
MSSIRSCPDGPKYGKHLLWILRAASSSYELPALPPPPFPHVAFPAKVSSATKTKIICNIEFIFVLNPHQNDQGLKGPCFFQRLIALKFLQCLKILSSEPNFTLRKYAFLNDFDNIKKIQKSKDDSILGHSPCEASI